MLKKFYKKSIHKPTFDKLYPLQVIIQHFQNQYNLRQLTHKQKSLISLRDFYFIVYRKNYLPIDKILYSTIFPFGN